MSNFKKPEMIRILNSLSIDMVHIKKGSFMMGEGENQKKVTIENDFEIGKYPVTVAEYMHFVKDVKKHYPKWLEEGSEYHIETGTNNHYKKMKNLQNPNAPIVGISWHDATAYCQWLSEKRKENFRLPTEKEWEYAAHAGTTTEWSYGDDEKKLGDYAWYDENSYDLGEEHENYGVQEVGQKKPNPWGLYDMYGNVWEWGEEWTDGFKDTKVLRGGSWYLNVTHRFNDRSWHNADDRSRYYGFRLLRTVE